jgi:serine/threonine protein kinase/tetratricopeptide (TPR) repeat protein
MIGKIISHYKITEELGRGGMGVVYKAEDTKLKRSVALKFLPPELTRDPEAKKRFIREAQTASSLDHPNICTIHEIGETADGQLFIVMSCYEGKTLKEKMVGAQHAAPVPEGSAIPLDQAISITVQIAEGLAKAHEKGIVHRDIKPANIFITNDGMVKILDFGLAKLAGQTVLTKTGTTVGTVAYMSPEQAKGEFVDYRTDIWSLGVVLYEMLTGELPFKGDYDQVIIYSILNEDLESLENIPAELQELINNCLIKDVNLRYQNIDEILIILQSIKKGHELDSPEFRIAQAKSVPSIAVLPFSDMSPARDQEYFCDGITEELINALTHIHVIHVVARTSAFSFKGMNIDVREIGRKLNVEHVIEGSVRKAKNRIRVTAQLVNVADGFHVWSEKYDRELKDIFLIQDEISLAIVDNLKIRLLRQEKAAILKRYTDNMEAYNLYLKGIYFLRMYTAEGFEKAIAYFEQALKMDSNYALAYYGQGEVFYAIAYWGNMPPNQAYPNARVFIKKALAIDKTLAEAHAGLGLIYSFYEWDWNFAEQELKEALRLNPNAAIIHISYSWFLSLIEHHDEAIAEAKRAQELDPLSGIIGAHVGLAYIWGGQYDIAIEELQLVLKVTPDFYLAHYYLGLAYRAKSIFDKAIVEFEKAVALESRASWPAMILATCYFEAGKKAEGQRLSERLEQRAKTDYTPPLGFFYIYHVQNKSDKAFEWLEKACMERDSFLPWCKVIPIVDYRFPDEPRVNDLLKRTGLK